MSWRLNPLTGTLDFFEANFSLQKSKTVVNNAFLSPRKVTLSANPILNSDYVFFNGLLITDDCYTILNDELTFVVGLDIRVGDLIDIRYAV